jgi:hypothetical protein
MPALKATAQATTTSPGVAEPEPASELASGEGNAFANDALVRARASESKGRTPGWFELLGQRFGTLSEVHDWVEAESEKPGSTVPLEPELRVTLPAGSIVHQHEATVWTHWAPDQKLVLDGAGAVVSGLRDGRPTPGFFLSYRPIVGAGTSGAAPAKANFRMTGLTVRGYESGGVEISPQSAPGDAHRWDGGIAAFVEGAQIDGNRFEQLGSKHTKPGKADWSKQRYGVGGVLFRGVSGASITGNVFDALENGEVAGTDDGPKLIHAVYLRDGSSGNTVTDNTFNHVSGDPVRVSNASNHNTIKGNTSRDAGNKALVSEFYNPTAGEADSVGNVVAANNIGTKYGSKQKAKRLHEAKSMQARPELA